MDERARLPSQRWGSVSLTRHTYVTDPSNVRRVRVTGASETVEMT